MSDVLKSYNPKKLVMDLGLVGKDQTSKTPGSLCSTLPVIQVEARGPAADVSLRWEASFSRSVVMS